MRVAATRPQDAKLGFLDGYPGLTYCWLLAWYEGLIVRKMRELEGREKGLPL